MLSSFAVHFCSEIILFAQKVREKIKHFHKPEIITHEAERYIAPAIRIEIIKYSEIPALNQMVENRKPQSLILSADSSKN